MIYTDREIEERFQEFLNKAYGTVKIAGLEYETAHALAEVDPIAYRCAFSDWLGSELGETLWELPGGTYTDEGPERAE